jgi:colanic acid biosynthesis glycosyl transferase WcaI
MNKAPKRFLVICQHFWPENFRINDIVDYFVEQGALIDVLCGIPNYPKGNFFDSYGYFKNRRQQKNGINIRRVFEIPRGNNSNFRILVNYLSFPIASIAHLPRLLTQKYDKIFLYSLSPVYMSFVGILVGKIKRVETTMYVLDLWPENLFSVLPIKNGLLRYFVTKTSHWHYKKVDKIVVLSERMRDYMINDLKIEVAKIIILPQSSEKLYENDIKDTFLEKRFRNNFTILYTGNISPAQSFDTMIDAAKKLHKKGYKNIHWLIVGDGMSKEDYEIKVKKEGLDQQFTFEGMKPIEDIPRYTTIADVLVGCLVKSDLLEATIPAKVMSYIAAGRPIVLSMDGEVRKMIEDVIQCGFVGPTENADALASNIEKVYKLNKKGKELLGSNARSYHFAHFERNISLKKLYDFLIQ